MTPALSAINDTEAERQLMESAVAEARADPRYVAHEDMRLWLPRLAKGEVDATPPGAAHFMIVR